MLRINRESPRAKVLLRLSGEIKGRWVGELGLACRDAEAAGKMVVLDLAEVSFIDLGGVALLRELRARRVRLTNCSLFVKEQLREVADVER